MGNIDFSHNIRTKPVSENYDKNYEQVFGKRNRFKESLKENLNDKTEIEASGNCNNGE